MQGTANALGIMAVAAATILALVVGYRRPSSIRDVLWGAFKGLALVVAASAASAHLCVSGQPSMQYLVPGGCLFLLTFANGGKMTSGVAWFVGIMAFLLSFHFLTITHSPQYTGNPDFAKAPLASMRSEERQIRIALIAADERGDIGSKTFPAGWMAESPLTPLLIDDGLLSGDVRRFTHVVSGAAHPLWHTWLTGIYAWETIPVDLWYPGGTLKDAADKLEWRPRLERR